MAELRQPIMTERPPLIHRKNTEVLGHIDDFTPEQLRELFSKNKGNKNVPIVSNNGTKPPLIHRKNTEVLGHIDDFTPEQLRELFSKNKGNKSVPIANNNGTTTQNKTTTQEDSPKTSIKEALGWGTVHGATLGYDDEIGALFAKEKYDDGVKRRRDYQKLLAKEHPYAYFAGNLAGGVAALVPAIVGGPVVAGGAAIGRGALAAIRAAPAAMRAMPSAVRAVPAAMRAAPAAVGRGAVATGRAIPSAIRGAPTAAKAVGKAVMSPINKAATRTSGAAADYASRAEAKAFQSALAQGATRAEAKLAGEAAAKKAVAKFNTIRAAKIGGIYGAIAGSGEGEGWGNTIVTTGFGGLFGGAAPFALSAAAPLVTKPASATPSFVKKTLPKWVRGSQPGEVQISNKALKEISRALDSAGIHDLDKALKWKGPDSMIIDLSDQLAARALREAKKDYPTHSTMSNRLGARQAESTQRVRERLNEALGEKVNTLDLKQDIINNAKREAEPLYEKAFTAPIAESVMKDLQLLEDSPAFNDARKKAIAGLLNVGDETVRANRKNPEMSMRILHRIKGDIDNQIKLALREDNQTHAADLMNVKERLLRVLDTSSPYYTQARKFYHDERTLGNALSQGEKAFDKNVTLDMIKNQLSGLESKELDAFRKGARSQIEHAAANVQSPENNLSSLFNTQSGQEKLRLIYGEDKANQMVKALRPEVERSELFARLPRNEGELGSKAGEALDNVSKSSLRTTIMNFFTGSVKRGVSSIDRNVERDIAELITAHERGDVRLSRQKSVELINKFRKAEQKRLITQEELVKFINLLNVLSTGSYTRWLKN
ncbi:hypothetical protein [Bartonella schoenbuchensis]|uniref:Uncharacterized protein n=1 Tax=Bartonella schoenbuchensis (strain DSM 13525 / NCTC 13165 / R1) TaxID=687861 RepID=E6Z065_BARSR|nr:hypothetical protein [Bartonella schoenbuchensis]AQX30968.1 hypothetical protein BscR1v2_010420 [Bartonella schoenbuchensis R1]CBI82503.1 conserved hypothetical protein [Bartonella schoenbuchensis R1]